ncbi:hypothetical protein IAT40_005820 [Kwoniella sp. CBS 6097]
MSDGYEFSQFYHASLVAYSPGTTFLATSYLNRIIVRSTSTLHIVRTWNLTHPSPTASESYASSSTSSSSRNHLGASSFSSGTGTSTKNDEDIKIDALSWSSDSMYLLAHSHHMKQAWIFGLASDGDGESGEIARIGGEGIEGLVRVEWGKKGGDVLAWSDRGHAKLKLSIYDLSAGMTSVVQNAKAPQDCHTYSPDNRYIAVAERHLGKEYVGVYDVLDGYTLFRHFSLQTTDVQGISWSPCGRYIAAWDSALSYSIHIHSPIGPRLSHFSSSSPTFTPAEDPGLGIRTVSWAPGGRFLALGGWDGRVRILESEGWRCVGMIQWSGKAVERDATVWREPSDWLRDTRGRGIIQFDRSATPSLLPSIRSDLSKPNPRIGVSTLSFDRDGTLLLIRIENQPNVIHIHTFLPTPTSESPSITHLASIVFNHPVKKAEWCPGDESKEKRIAVATKQAGKIEEMTGGGTVYFWDAEAGWVEDDETGLAANEYESRGARGLEETSDAVYPRGGMMEGVGVPSRSAFSASDVHWAPDGSSLLIHDKAQLQFCVLYDGDESQVSEPATSTHDISYGHGTYNSRSIEMSDEGYTNTGEGLTYIEEGDEDSEEGWGDSEGLDKRDHGLGMELSGGQAVRA